MTSRTRALLSILTLFLLSYLLGCAGSGQAPEQHESDQHDDGTLGLVSVKMRPQQPVLPPFSFELRGTSSTPRALLDLLSSPASPPAKASSYEWLELYRAGSDYSLLLPYNNVVPGADSAHPVVFEPQFDPALGLASAAYCIYEFDLPGYSLSSGEPTVAIGMLLPAVQKVRCYVGVANFDKNVWDWFAFPEDDVLTLGSFAPYESPAGKILIALVGTGTESFSLNFTSIGKLEERGTGDLGLAPPDLVTMLPSFASILALPEIVDLSPDCSPINDQGGIGSCTAFANVDSAFNYELGQTYYVYGWDFSDDFNLCSPRFVYNQTGVDLGGSCPTGGRTTNDVGNWLLAEGTATELNAPYGSLSAMSYNCGTAWSPAALADAALLVPDSKTFIGTDIGGGNYRWTDADIAIAKNVLKNLGHPIVFRTFLDSNFGSVNYASGATWEYNGSSIGGHAMCIVGYNTGLDGGTGAFKVRNSWGTDFGDNGYCWISFDSFRSNTAGVYGYYFTEDCDSAVVSRFRPGTGSYFWVCKFWISILFVDKIVLNWEEPEGALRYEIYRDTMDGNPIGIAQAGENSFTDDTVEDFDAHVYWIVAIDDTGKSSPPSRPIVGWRKSPPN